MGLTRQQKRTLKYLHKATSQDIYDLMDYLSKTPNALDELGALRFDVMLKLHQVGLSRHLSMPPLFLNMIKGYSRNSSLYHPRTNHERVDIIGHEYSETEFQPDKD